MNRENKRKTFEKDYYKTHACRDTFTCKVCGRLCTPENAGSDHRNHCPNCLSSLHVDIEPGDRESDCGGIMEPVAVWVRRGGEWAIIHRCKRCGALSSNRVAADDNPMKLMSIAMRPLSAPPFPLERIEVIPALRGAVGSVLYPPQAPGGAAWLGWRPPLPLDKDRAGSRTAVRAGVSFVFRFCTGDCKTGKPMV